MAEGRFGVGPRVVLTVVATVLLTGVVTAAGGGFDAEPGPGSTTTSTSSTTTPTSTSTTEPSDPEDIFDVFVWCFKEAEGAVAKLTTARSGNQILTKVEVRSAEVRKDCPAEIEFCTKDRPYELPDAYPNRETVQEIDGDAQVRVADDDADDPVASVLIIKRSQGRTVDTRLDFAETVACDGSGGGPNRSTTTTEVSTTTMSSPSRPNTLPTLTVPGSEPDGTSTTSTTAPDDRPEDEERG